MWQMEASLTVRGIGIVEVILKISVENSQEAGHKSSICPSAVMGLEDSLQQLFH